MREMFLTCARVSAFVFSSVLTCKMMYQLVLFGDLIMSDGTRVQPLYATAMIVAILAMLITSGEAVLKTFGLDDD